MAGAVDVAVDLPIKTDHGLKRFLRYAFGVTIPDTQICPGHSTPFRAYADAYFARHPVIVWKASRGLGGKTFLLSSLSLVEGVTLGADVNLLGGSGEQSQRALSHIERFWMHPSAPRELLRDDPTRREQRFVGGNKIHALMASTASVRGPHPQRLRGDEIDEMDLSILDAAMGQPMSSPDVRSQVVLSSTHHYADGTMQEVLNRALAKGWPIHEWCYRETMAPHGWLSAEEVSRKREQMSEATWKNEVELQQPEPESRAISPEAVEAMFQPALGTFNPGNMERIVTEKRDPMGLYITAADWARESDKTEIGTLRYDCTPARLVAYQWMNRVAWPAMVSRFDEQVREYHDPWNKTNTQAIHDALGIGNVVAGYMTVEAHGETQVQGQHRVSLYNNIINAIERGAITSPLIVPLKRQLQFASVEDIYGNGHVPDGLSMLALAWKGATMKRSVWRTG